MAFTKDDIAQAEQALKAFSRDQGAMAKWRAGDAQVVAAYNGLVRVVAEAGTGNPTYSVDEVQAQKQTEAAASFQETGSNPFAATTGTPIGPASVK